MVTAFGDATTATKAACLCVAAAGLVLLSAGRRWWISTSRPEPLPPGPPGELLIGHLRVIPKDGTAEAYAKWGREYGTFVPGSSVCLFLDSPITLHLFNYCHLSCMIELATLVLIMSWNHFTCANERHKKTLNKPVSSTMTE